MSETRTLWAGALALVALTARAASVYDPDGVTVSREAVTLETVGETIWTSDLSSGWKVFDNYGEHLEITFGAGHRGRRGVVVRGFETNRTDTAWSVRSDPVRLTKKGPSCLITFDLACDREVKDSGCNTEQHRTAVLWLDGAGKRIGAERIPVKMPAGDYGRVRFRGRIPSGAEAFQIQLGFDGPNLINGQKAAYANVTFAVEAERPQYLRKGTFTSEWMPKGALRCRADKPQGTAVEVRAIDVDRPHFGYCRVAVALTGNGAATPSVRTVTVGNRVLRDWTTRTDALPPRVRNAFPSPTTNRRERLVFDVTDDSAVDVSCLKVLLDGQEATDAFEWRDGRLASKPRTAPWKEGLHTVDVTIGDVHANRVTAKKRFFVGEAAKTPKVTLRDDGVTLVDGVPYFPIGMYGVMRREFNGHDFEKAFDGLAAGGFNTSHSYSETFDDAYLAACANHGFRKIQFARLPDYRMTTKSRFDPSVIAWYLGDDTSVCEKPWELWDYEDAVKALDPNRLTCQADAVGASAEVSCYRNYVTGTDVFLPEIYPTNKEDPGEVALCAAKAIRDMKRIASDVAEAGDRRAHATWPIIQYFKGWGWQHFPTKAELHAMTFATICHGAKGMFWYAYCGMVDPAKKKFNCGVTSSPERWATICELATRLKELSPVLVTRTPPQPAKPEIVTGPAVDGIGNDSISYLLKTKGDEAWLFAVNSAAARVAVRFRLDAFGAAEVLYENRSVTMSDGVLADVFEPLAVHIYRFRPVNRSLPPVERLAVVGARSPALVKNGRCRFALVGRLRREDAFRGPENRTLVQFGRNAVRRGMAHLAKMFGETTGMAPPVLDEDDAKAASFPLVIAVGRTRWSERLGMDPKTLPPEGFEVRTFDGGVCIVGRDWADDEHDIFCWRSPRMSCNGSEFGCRDFAERFLGVRDYAMREGDLWSVRPKVGELALLPVAYRDYPRFRMRDNPAYNWRLGVSTDIFCTEAPNPFAFAKAHADRLDDLFYRDGGGTLWQSDATYGQNYFDVTNPKLAETLIEDWRTFYAQNGKGSYWGECWTPTARNLFFGQVDAYRVLDNERARAYVDPADPRNMSDVYAAFHVDLAKRAAKAFPGKRLCLMAYANFLKPPRLVDRMPDNVQMLVCCGSPLFIESPEYRRTLDETLTAWAAMTRFKPALYVYDAGFASDAVIAQTLRGLYEGPFLRCVRGRIDEEFVFPCFAPGTKRYSWSFYPACLSLWNPETDTEAVLEEYFRLMFGAKAGARLNAFHHKIAARWSEHYVREATNVYGSIPGPDYRVLYTKTFPANVVRELTAELDAVEGMLQEGSKERRRFEAFAKPYRGIFPDIVAYQRISFPDIRVPRRTSGIVTDGVANEPAWRAVTPLAFQRSFAGGPARQPTPRVRLLWDGAGLYLSIDSPAPIRSDADLWKGDSIELFLTRGNGSPHLYQFVMAASGAYEDWYKQLDPPRLHDANWKAEGAKYVARRNPNGWTGEFFVPWTALNDAAPRSGDVWKANVVSNRRLPACENQSVSPTLQNNRRIEMYSRLVFD